MSATPTRRSALGAKGAGEAGTAGAPAAVHERDQRRAAAPRRAPHRHALHAATRARRPRRRPRESFITRRRTLLAASAAATLPLPGLVRAQGTGPIRIGFPAPLTGAFGTEAQDQVRAAELAVKEFNEAGGFGGRKAELLVRDDKLNPGEAATRTLELIEKDKVDFIVGSLSAATQLSINAVGKERKILFNSHQPVRRHQRGQGLEPLHLPRGAQPAHDRRRGGPLRRFRSSARRWST